MKDGKLIYSFHIHFDLFVICFHHTILCYKELEQIVSRKESTEIIKEIDEWVDTQAIR